MEKKMKISLKKRALPTTPCRYPNLPFGEDDDDDEEVGTSSSKQQKIHHHHDDISSDITMVNSRDLKSEIDVAQSLQQQGNILAEDGRFKEALGKWESAIHLVPDTAVLHEQKAQVLLEIGDAWAALKAATRASELEPTWAEAWITLARTQLNFGEPDAAIKSLDKALALKPDCKEAQVDLQTAMNLVKKRKQLQLSGLSANENRFIVGENSRACQVRMVLYSWDSVIMYKLFPPTLIDHEGYWKFSIYLV
ncbi:hypothetical protein ACHQM5_022914 [Ranunculus cassubicifolius]